jgi:hypothetical protein
MVEFLLLVAQKHVLLHKILIIFKKQKALIKIYQDLNKIV